ncbi:DUF427 domain-containing protein [Streptomyces sp. NPDC026092]|uniref:DUF427 domain-containing protein n=1 Tax=Streptomyces sp. NPDC026092 TaxID=3154797 RepID=UPI0033DCBCAD
MEVEMSHPPVFDVPRGDVRTDLFSLLEATSNCEWKGVATYWTLVVERLAVRDAAWSYEAPSPGYESIAGHLAFYAGRADLCTVDGERVRAQGGDFYGGWITDEILGPFKGGLGISGS